MYWKTVGRDAADARSMNSVGEWDYADIDVIAALKAGTLTSETLDAIRGYLWAYAFATLHTHIRTGRIENLCRDKQRPVQLTDYDRAVLRDNAAVDELVMDVLLAADPVFFEKSVHLWSPEKDAALPTYFVGMCLLVFANTHKSWNKTRASQREVAIGQAEADFVKILQNDSLLSNERDPEQNAVTCDALAVIAKVASPDERVLLGHLLQGHSTLDISEALGLTTRQVEGRLRRLRLRVKVGVRRGDIPVPAGIRPSEQKARRLGSIAA